MVYQLKQLLLPGPQFCLIIQDGDQVLNLTGIHRQVAQAARLQNIDFIMSTGNGFGGFMHFFTMGGMCMYALTCGVTR